MTLGTSKYCCTRYNCFAASFFFRTKTFRLKHTFSFPLSSPVDFFLALAFFGPMVLPYSHSSLAVEGPHRSVRELIGIETERIREVSAEVPPHLAAHVITFLTVSDFALARQKRNTLRVQYNAVPSTPVLRPVLSPTVEIVERTLLEKQQESTLAVVLCCVSRLMERMDDDDDNLFEIDDDDDDEGIEGDTNNPLATAHPTAVVVAAAAAAASTATATVTGEILSSSPEDLPIEEGEEQERGMGSDPYDPNDWGDVLGGAEANEAETRQGKALTVLRLLL